MVNQKNKKAVIEGLLSQGRVISDDASYTYTQWYVDALCALECTIHDRGKCCPRCNRLTAYSGELAEPRILSDTAVDSTSMVCAACGYTWDLTE